MDFKEDIETSIKVLRAGGVILYPTDTVWGIGCDATNKEAVEKIFEIKKREGSKSLIALASDAGMLNRFVKDIPAQAWDLMEVSDSPLTIVYDSPRGLAANVLADDGSMALRIPDDEFCKRLIHRLGKPLISTSANKSGEPAPLCFNEINNEIKTAVDHVVRWRQNDTAPGRPSAIIKLRSNGEVTIIRK